MAELHSMNAAINALIERIVARVGEAKDGVDSGCIDHLHTIIADIKEFTEAQLEHITRLNEIGAALSAEHNLSKLLEMILIQAKKFTNADAGTLYLTSPDGKKLHFSVVQTDSLGIQMGGTHGEITWPPLPLYSEDGQPNRQMVAALCALEGRLINIDDVYNAEGFNFEGTKKFDAGTGYRSKSMLVIPMRNHEGEIIGVLQLLNRLNERGEVISFSTDDEKTTMSLASQAAVAITNTQLVHDLETLLDSFIRAIAAAIDEKSPYTGGHIRRVAELAMMIAQAVNDDDGIYKDVHYTEAQLKEIYFSAWMHDVGKITTPEHIIDKATKLKTVYDRIHTIETRYEVLKRDAYIAFLEGKITQEAYKASLASLSDEIEFIKGVNIGGEFMSDDKIARLQEIASRRIIIDGKERPLLDADELYNLSIRKGTLTDEERQKINDHAMMSYKMLNALPFPKKLRRVPEIAAAHHEKLNGKGYPLGLTADQISLEGRILALADIFEALTAADRPYKKAKTLDEVYKILSFMVKNYELDPDLVNFFYEHGLPLLYAQKELKPEQYASYLPQESSTQ
ncbi:MAG: HD domain-containing protein [Campylobacterales bacterium]